MSHTEGRWTILRSISLVNTLHKPSQPIVYLRHQPRLTQLASLICQRPHV